MTRGFKSRNPALMAGFFVSAICLKHFCLSTPSRHLVKATTPCVVAYGYVRIRRLVRFWGGIYRFSVTDKISDRGLVDPPHRRIASPVSALLWVASYGGHAQGSFRGAGSDARSTNLRMATTLRLVARWRWSLSNSIGVPSMPKPTPHSKEINSTAPSQIAAQTLSSFSKGGDV